MKSLKNLFLFSIIISATLTLNSCKKCKGENPRAMIINQGAEVVSVQIKTSGGNTENINNIAPGTSSELRSFAPGITKFTIAIGNQSEAMYEYQLMECYDSKITIDAYNNVSLVSDSRN